MDDPDEHVFHHVRDQLIHHGRAAIPFLESSWENEEFGLIFQTRIEALLDEIQFSIIREDLQRWIDSPEKDLLEGALIVARFQYPSLDEQAIRSKIQEIRKDIWLEINERQTAYEKVRVFNKIFYGKYGFSGNSKNYNSPLNSYINIVLDTRKGNPLSLGILYSIIAQSLDMPVYGVNLPNHFVLTYLDENNINAMINPDNKHGSLFYINAFSRGGIFDESEIKSFLDGLGKPHERKYFEPCTHSAIIVRMLTNLITAFQQAGSAEKVNQLIHLRDLFDHKI